MRAVCIVAVLVSVSARTRVLAQEPPEGPVSTPLTFVRHREEFVLSPDPITGAFDTQDLETARRAFAPSPTHRGQDVHPALLERVYKAVRHFQRYRVHIVSGVRDGRATSRHTHGRAIDFTLEGVEIRTLATFLRTLGFSGVGLYPRSGFVHLDVRSQSYYWIDQARRGRRGRVRQRWTAESTQADAEARARGELPLADVVTAEEGEEETVEAQRRRHRERLRERRAEQARRERAQRQRRGRRNRAPTESSAE